MRAVVIDDDLHYYHEPRETLDEVANDILHFGAYDRLKCRIIFADLLIMLAHIATETDKILEFVEIVFRSLLLANHAI
jgi:hypothetical protein